MSSLRVGAPPTLVSPMVMRRYQTSADEKVLRSLNVPSAWFSHCQVLRSDFGISEDPANVLGVDLCVGGQDPERSVAELSQAADLGLGLSLRLAEFEDLSSMTGIIPNLTRLTLFSESGRARGWETLGHAKRLRFLRVSFDAESPMRLEQLTRLERFEGVGEHAAGVVELESLRTLKWSKPSPDRLESIAGRLQVLELQNAVGVGKMPDLVSPQSLEELRVDGAEDFSIGDLELTGLREVAFTNCRRVTGVAALGKSTCLDYVEFRNVQQLDEWATLLELNVNVGVVAGRHSIPLEVRGRVIGSRYKSWAIER